MEDRQSLPGQVGVLSGSVIISRWVRKDTRSNVDVQAESTPKMSVYQHFVRLSSLDFSELPKFLYIVVAQDINIGKRKAKSQLNRRGIGGCRYNPGCQTSVFPACLRDG